MHVWCTFCDSSPKIWRVIVRTSRISSNSLSQNELKIQCQWPSFSIPAESILGYMFGANLVILAQTMTSYCADKPNFLEFSVKMAKMILKVTVNDLQFQYQPSVSQDACLVQIWWFQLKFVTSYGVDKVKFTDRWTDGRTDWGNDNTLRPERPRGNTY